MFASNAGQPTNTTEQRHPLVVERRSQLSAAATETGTRSYIEIAARLSAFFGYITKWYCSRASLIVCSSAWWRVAIQLGIGWKT